LPAAESNGGPGPAPKNKARQCSAPLASKLDVFIGSLLNDNVVAATLKQHGPDFALMGKAQPAASATLDDPATTIEHGRRIQSKPALRRLYQDNYAYFKAASADVPAGGRVLELGSGGGFLKEVLPDAITSDVLPLPGCDLVLSAEALPFDDGALRAIVMFDVLHHIKNVEPFFREAQRCLMPGGKIVAIEPASTAFARFIWKNFHHEPYREDAGWTVPEQGPLSGANGALPWILFFRDRALFEQRFPDLKIVRIDDHTPFVYLLSGGVRPWTLLPGFLYSPVRRLERALHRLGLHIGLFWSIELMKSRG
jgi:SAM-dependent methyltransferase